MKTRPAQSSKHARSNKARGESRPDDLTSYPTNDLRLPFSLVEPHLEHRGTACLSTRHHNRHALPTASSPSECAHRAATLLACHISYPYSQATERPRPHATTPTMVRNILLFAGSSHPQLVESICAHLAIPPAKITLGKFMVGETRVEVGESVRGKDVFIVQTACSTKNGGSGGMSLNDGLMELLITISACKTASARRVIAVLPLFPYSRQSDLPYNKVGAPLARMPTKTGDDDKYTFDSRPGTPGPGNQRKDEHLEKSLKHMTNGVGELHIPPRRKDTIESVRSEDSSSGSVNGYKHASPTSAPNSAANGTSTTFSTGSAPPDFKPQRGYKQWVAQAGTLVADLLTSAGADHVITMDLHDPQYQGFFDIPVDNLYGRNLLKRYITHDILPHEGGADECVIVSPDAGGAKRATSIADALGMEFALIHKVRRNTVSGCDSF